LKNFNFLNLKKITAAIIASVLLIVIFTACGKNENIKYSDTTHLFTQTEITIPKKYTYIHGSAYANGNFYLLADRSETKIVPIPESGHPWAQYMSPEELSTASDGTPIPDGMMETNINYTTVVVVDQNGNIIEEKDLSVNDYLEASDTSTWYGSMFTSPDGKLLAMKTTSTTTVDADGNYNSENVSSLITFDTNWNETPYFDLGKAMEGIPEEERMYFSTDQMIFKGDYLYTFSYSGIYVFDVPNVKFLFSLTAEQGNMNGGEWYQGMFDLGGEVAVAVQKQKQEGDTFTNENKLKVIDPALKGFGAEYDFNVDQMGNSKSGNADYPIIVSNGSALSSFDYKTGEETLLIDFLASGYSLERFESVMIMDADHIAMIISEPNYIPSGLNSWSSSSQTTKIVIFNKIPPEEVKPRQLISVYCYYEDRNFLEFAADFNKHSTEYEIETKVYNSDYTDTPEDVITRMNNDILSGNIPDILLINSLVPYDSYAAKGLFYDINKYLEKDEELSRSDINENILRVFEKSGKLYSLPKSYTLSSLIGKTSIFGESTKLTAEIAAEKLAAYPEATLFGQTTQQGFISGIIGAQQNSFINYETGEVSFDTPEFVDILELAKELPAEIDYNNIDYSEYERMYFDNKALVSSLYVSDFRAIIQTEYQQFGEDVTIMGYPNPNNSGILLSPNSELAIMAKGNHSAAWEVLKGYLRFETKNPMMNRYGLSVLNAKIDENAAAAKVPVTYIDPASGATKEARNTVYMGSGDEIEYPNNTDADNQRVYGLLENLGSVVRSDESLNKIIEEETSAYFGGSKTAEECAKLIQNRASTYIAESR
jgi:hypothetical protein